MILTGMEGKLETSKAQDLWRNKTSRFIEQYWNINNATTEATLEFKFSQVVTHIELQEFTTGRRRLRRRQTESEDQRRLRILSDDDELRIIFTQDYTVRGSEDTIVPDEIFMVPLQDPNYIAFLNQDNDGMILDFMNVTNVSTRRIASASPSLRPSEAPSVSPVGPLDNGSGEPLNAISAIMIAFASLAGFLIVWMLFIRNPRGGFCKQIDANAAVPAGSQEEPEVEKILELSGSRGFLHSYHVGVVADDGQIDLSELGSNMDENPQYNVQDDDIDDDEESDESDSMLSYGDCCSHSEQGEGEDDVKNNEFGPISNVPKLDTGTKPDTIGKNRNKKAKPDKRKRSNSENLVVTGAPLSPSR